MKKLLLCTAPVLALVGSACTDSDEAPTDSSQLKLTMSATLGVGEEKEHCKFVKIPETWVTKDHVDFRYGSHHMLLWQTPYTEIPTQRLDGVVVDTTKVFDCTDGLPGHWSYLKAVGGSQNPGGDSMLIFPEGVAAKIGGVMLMNVHYRNDSDEPLDITVNLSYDTIPADQVVAEGDMLYLYNPLISVPAGASTFAQWRCPVYHDITISSLQGHMHVTGVLNEAKIASDAGSTGAAVYSTDAWENVPVQPYTNLQVKAGQKIDYRCDYRNSSNRSIYQGPLTTDEMCLLIGSYYPADTRTTLCLNEAGTRSGGEWIGGGTATCEQAMTCLKGATTLQAQTDCVLNASPNVSRQISNVFSCFSTAKTPQTECADQILACTGH